uniref:Secreted protein n=1 Tax=Panagrellus redivivus TaxID=6233 RepID=A0A7E4V8M6_PANRE
MGGFLSRICCCCCCKKDGTSGQQATPEPDSFSMPDGLPTIIVVEKKPPPTPPSEEAEVPDSTPAPTPATE